MIVWGRPVTALFLLGSGSILALSLLLAPDVRNFGTHEQLGLPPCRYLERTGRPCGTCGMTTAFALCARGRFLRAFEANPGGPILFLLVLAVALGSARALYEGGPAGAVWSKRGLLLGFLGMVAGLAIPFIARS